MPTLADEQASPLGFQCHALTHRAPIWVRSSTNMPLATAPSGVCTSTKTTAPRRRAGSRSRRGVRAGVPMLDHMSTLDGVTAAELRRLSLVGEYEMTVALRGRAAGRLELAREALMLRCFSGLGVELSAGFRGTLVVVK